MYQLLNVGLDHILFCVIFIPLLLTRLKTYYEFTVGEGWEEVGGKTASKAGVTSESILVNSIKHVPRTCSCLTFIYISEITKCNFVEQIIIYTPILIIYSYTVYQQMVVCKKEQKI